MHRFTAVNQTSPALRFTDYFNIHIVDDPSGSTVVLQKEVLDPDTGVLDFVDLYDNGTLISFSVRDYDEFRNKGNARFRLRCSVYGGTPFRVELSGDI